MKIEKLIPDNDTFSEEDHFSTNASTPLRKDAFKLSDDEKIVLIQEHFKYILDTLGMDLNDDSISGTPLRVAKMYVKELFGGLHPDKKPKASTFKNSYKYEHHFLPIVGKAHVAYISNGSVVGLSKINRIVDYYAKRPQVQERLTLQIVQELQKVLNTKDVACVIDAKHLCVNSRGVSDISSSTVTSEFGGSFKKEDKKLEFLDYIKLDTDFNE